MAFSTGSAEMNVTPLIDVLLVLLIIFMLIVPVAPRGEQAVIPQPSEKETAPPPVRTIVIQLSANASGKADLRINEEPTTWENLKARLMEIYKERAERVAFVRADASMDFEQVAQVIDVAHAAGVVNVGLMK